MICYDFPTKQWCGLGADKDYDLPSAIKRVQDDIAQFASDLRNYICAPASPYEAANWPIKRAEAKAYLASGAPAPALQAEATYRGVTLAEVVAKVSAKADQIALVEAVISGTSGKHRDAVAKLLIIDDVLGYNWSTGWPI